MGVVVKSAVKKPTAKKAVAKKPLAKKQAVKKAAVAKKPVAAKKPAAVKKPAAAKKPVVAKKPPVVEEKKEIKRVPPRIIRKPIVIAKQIPPEIPEIDTAKAVAFAMSIAEEMKRAAAAASSSGDNDSGIKLSRRPTTREKGPDVPLNSSTTTAMCSRLRRKSSNRSSMGLFSGTKYAGRTKSTQRNVSGWFRYGSKSLI